MSFLQVQKDRFEDLCRRISVRFSSQRGLAALEYIALAVLIVVAVAGAFEAFGVELRTRVSNLMSDIFP